jgi:hypothetical protein
MTAAFYAALNDIPMNCYRIDMKKPGALYGLGDVRRARLLLAAGRFVLGAHPLELPGDLLAASMICEAFETLAD